MNKKKAGRARKKARGNVWRSNDWILTSSNSKDITVLQGKTKTFFKWGDGFEAFVKAHSPCQIFIKSDFFSDNSEDFDKGLTLAETLGTKVWATDAEEFAREKKRLLSNPQTRAHFETLKASFYRATDSTDWTDQWEFVQSGMKERGVLIGEYFAELKQGTLAFEFFQRALNSPKKHFDEDLLLDFRDKGTVFDMGDEVLFVLTDSSALYPGLPQAKENGTSEERRAYKHLQETWDQYSEATDLARQKNITMHAGPRMTLRLQQWALYGGAGGELAQKILSLFPAPSAPNKQLLHIQPVPAEAPAVLAASA
jgi:hypothetical protein